MYAPGKLFSIRLLAAAGALGSFCVFADEAGTDSKPAGEPDKAAATEKNAEACKRMRAVLSRLVGYSVTATVAPYAKTLGCDTPLQALAEYASKPNLAMQDAEVTRGKINVACRAFDDLNAGQTLTPERLEEAGRYLGYRLFRALCKQFGEAAMPQLDFEVIRGIVTDHLKGGKLDETKFRTEMQKVIEEAKPIIEQMQQGKAPCAQTAHTK